MKMTYKDIQNVFIKNIDDMYTLNLAMDVLQDREILKDKLDKKTICGMSLNKAFKILNGLSLERIIGIEMTMDNLKMYEDMIFKEIKDNMDKNICVMNKNINNLNSLKCNENVTNGFIKSK